LEWICFSSGILEENGLLHRLIKGEQLVPAVCQNFCRLAYWFVEALSNHATMCILQFPLIGSLFYAKGSTPNVSQQIEREELV
jgi:hypothetical protein